MSRSSLWTDLLGIQGWEVGSVRLEDGDAIVTVRRRTGTRFRCSRCGEGVLFAYDSRGVRQIRDFAVWGRRCFLEAELMRVDCPQCGVVVEGLDWVEPYARHTVRYLPVNLSALNRFEDGARVDESALREAGLANGRSAGIKILGNGELTRKLTVCAHAFSAAAKTKIEAKGGSCELASAGEAK